MVARVGVSHQIGVAEVFITGMKSIVKGIKIGVARLNFPRLRANTLENILEIQNIQIRNLNQGVRTHTLDHAHAQEGARRMLGMMIQQKTMPKIIRLITGQLRIMPPTPRAAVAPPHR